MDCPPTAGAEAAAPEPASSAAAEALAAAGPGDTTGTDTLNRYAYQVKVAVQKWLGTLASGHNVQIVCEYVDDITTVEGDGITFTQVKTRDRGAWSVAKILADGGGVDALVRSYNHAKSAGLTPRVHLELLLEGVESDRADTRSFFATPASATNEQRRSLIGHGLDASDLDDFLLRLTVTSQYHARQSIDAVTLFMLMGVAPVLPVDLQQIYRVLLDRALAAHLGASGGSTEDSPLVLRALTHDEPTAIFAGHALTRAELLTILPLTPELANEQRKLLEAANGGALAMTNLEFKLIAAGASASVIDRAKAVRADAATRLSQRAGIADGGDDELGYLRDRLLEYAEAVTADVVASSGGAGSNRMANAIYGRLTQQFQQLAALDGGRVFGADGRSVLGYLCELSDECVYQWRMP